MKSSRYLFLIILAITICVLGIIPIIHGIYSLGLDGSSLGDYVGGTSGALWSLGGVILVYLAFKGQQDDFEFTKDQFRVQNFDNHLFQMLQLHGNQIQNLDVHSSSKTTKGVDCFGLFYDNFKSHFVDEIDGGLEERFSLAFGKMEKRFPIDIPLYINSMEGIVEHVISEKKIAREKYFKLIFHQLTSYEIALIYYAVNKSEPNKVLKVFFDDREIRPLVERLLRKQELIPFTGQEIT